MDTIEIREMQPSDYAAVRALWEQTPGIGLSAADEPGAITSFLDRNPGLSFVASEGGRLVGTALCGHDGRRGYLYHLAVHSDARGRGIGSALVQRALDALSACGIVKCHLFVFRDNVPGNAFWTRTGWVLRKDLNVFSKDIGISRRDRATGPERLA